MRLGRWEGARPETTDFDRPQGVRTVDGLSHLAPASVKNRRKKACRATSNIPISQLRGQPGGMQDRPTLPSQNRCSA